MPSGTDAKPEAKKEARETSLCRGYGKVIRIGAYPSGGFPEAYRPGLPGHGNNMTKARWTKRRKIKIWVGGGLLFLISLGGFWGWTDPLEYLALDFHFKLRPEVDFPQEIAVIGVDEASLDALGQWPWPREHHAALIGLLRYESFRPSIVGYDLLFESRSSANPPGDLALIYQVQSFPNPFITAYFFEKSAHAVADEHPNEDRLSAFALPERGHIPPQIETASRTSLPYKDLADVSELAFVNTPMDPDGKTRHAQLLILYQEQVYPSIDLMIALHALRAKLEDVRLLPGRIVIEKSLKGRIEIPINDRGEMMINYYGSSQKIRSYSFVQILNAGKDWMAGADSPEILRSLKDKIVIVGVTALGLGDRRVTPMARYETGVSLHAQAVANILDNRFLEKVPGGWAFLVWFLAGATALLTTLSWHFKRSLPAVFVLEAFLFLLSHYCFLKGLWIPLAGPLLVVLAIFIGVTSAHYFTALEELRQTQRQLIQSAKMAALGELSASMAHEFKNILQAISLHVEFAVRPASTPEKSRKSMERVQDVLESAKGILQGLLTFARKSESRPVPGEMRKTVESTLLMMSKQLALHRVRIHTELEDVPAFAYDGGQISQVLMNLIGNARDAMEGQGEKKLVIRLKALKKGSLLEVEDNGPGLPEIVRRHLFQPFITTKPEGKGTGLGLSVCHGIIQNHGGEITVKSEPGQGTLWSIFLPFRG